MQVGREEMQAQIDGNIDTAGASLENYEPKRPRESYPPRKSHFPLRRRSPVDRRSGSPRRNPDFLSVRRNSPIHRRGESLYRHGETPPRRRPVSPVRGGLPSSPPRRNRSRARDLSRRIHGSHVRRKSPIPSRHRSPPRRARSPTTRSPINRRRSRSPIQRLVRSGSRLVSPRRGRAPVRRCRRPSSYSGSPSLRRVARRISRNTRTILDLTSSACNSSVKMLQKPESYTYQWEDTGFSDVERKKDFICMERVNGKTVNILDGLELHTSVFNAREQKKIVDFVYDLQEMGKKGHLKERSYTAPRKWKRGKGRVTIQFGCCYNYATDKNGNPPGILQTEMVDPIPSLFKTMIRRLVRWHVLPPSCVPDSCIVNIYGREDCIPPHIDHRDFVRPFCTVSFLSECSILFGSILKPNGPGDFCGSFAIPLPVGSVLVFNGNGADVAQHCVPAVSTKRISITFRKMAESKRPIKFIPEPDLQGLQPLSAENERSKRRTSSRHMLSGSNNRLQDRIKQGGY